MKFVRLYDDNELYEAIVISFSNDYDLIKKYHVIEGTLVECVTDTYLKIREASEMYPMEWYKVLVKGRVVGYCIMCQTYSFLYSFGINMQYRNRMELEDFFSQVKKYFGQGFTCGLWAKNTRAIDFLIKNGMQIYESDESAVHLKYN